VRILICLLLGLFFSADSTLPNGIHTAELPSGGKSFEIIAGYTSGVRNETTGSSGLAAIVSEYLASSAAARSIALAAYGSGGKVEQLAELDRTALKVEVPLWAAPMIQESIAAYLAQVPDQDMAAIERGRLSVLRLAREHDGDFRQKVEDEIRLGLLGFHPYAHRVPAAASDVDRLTDGQIVQFFKDNFGTNHAFVVTSGPLPEPLKSKLMAIPARASETVPMSVSRVLNAERVLKFGSGADSAGAVILAAPVPGVYYREWYSFLLLDRLAHRVLPETPATALVLTVDPYYWRLEIPVPAGQFADTVNDNLSQDIQRLQFVRAKPDDLEAARRSALDFLNSPYVQGWFASEGISERRQEGLQWIQSFTADDIRASVRDLLLANHLTASWSPKPSETTVEIQSLISDSASSGPIKTASETPLSAVAAPVFPAHDHSPRAYAAAEKLNSGVWLAASSTPAIFLAGPASLELPEGSVKRGANGTLWKFTREPGADIVKAFQKFRAGRLLILAPAADLEQARSLWNAFKSNPQDAAAVTPSGPVANIDIPALMVLKAEIDRKLIESGWWTNASLQFDATKGAVLDIQAPAEEKAQILTWIKAIASAPMPDADFDWAREAAWNHVNETLPDMESLVWMRDPQYIMEGVETVAASQVQEAARLYF
jgi:hypothetical protein